MREPEGLTVCGVMKELDTTWTTKQHLAGVGHQRALVEVRPSGARPPLSSC